jgi:hypothetical protein
VGRREEWRKVLDSEVRRWSSMGCEQLTSELHYLQAYEVDLDSKKYQVEVELLEDTDKYVHVMVAVDDGSLPASISPLTQTFICSKPQPTIQGANAVSGGIAGTSLKSQQCAAFCSRRSF